MKQSEELGQVSWYRDYDHALNLSAKENKPVLILFQEVPGCITCRNYGHHVLSHPLMVEAIENEFIPLAIYNNKGGNDQEILKLYNEPSWNNPVARIVDENGQNLVPRIAQNYSIEGLFSAMKQSLLNQKKKIPTYMSLLEQEIGISNTEEKYYKMYCFWSGEHHIGKKEGVLKTEAGFMGGNEVVKVTYNSSEVSDKELDRHAEKEDCISVKESNFSFSEKDHNYKLRHTHFKYLPLTEIQKTKINAHIDNESLAVEYLSPSQKEWYQRIKNGKMKGETIYNLDFEKAWRVYKN